MAIIVPYSLDSKMRKANQGKKIADQKGISEKVKTAAVPHLPTARWKEEFILYVNLIKGYL